jgi:hypothetical protein
MGSAGQSNLILVICLGMMRCPFLLPGVYLPKGVASLQGSLNAFEPWMVLQQFLVDIDAEPPAEKVSK